MVPRGSVRQPTRRASKVERGRGKGGMGKRKMTEKRELKGVGGGGSHLRGGAAAAAVGAGRRFMFVGYNRGQGIPYQYPATGTP